MNQIDHIVWAAGDLDAAISEFEARTGVRAAMGGSHPGRGTRNALVSLGPGCYLEILAPDPAQPPTRTFLLPPDIERPFLLSFAVACSDIEATVFAIERAGFVRPEINSMSRRTQSGAELNWRLATITNHPFGLTAPFLIDWGSTPHPSQSAPGGDSCRLLSLRASHPDARGLGKLMQAIGIDVVCESGNAGLSAKLQTPGGDISLGPAR
jgi:hypothetical protein